MELLASTFLPLSPLSPKPPIKSPHPNPNFISSRQKSILPPIRSSTSPTFNGWDDLALVEAREPLKSSLNFDPILRFFTDDPKHAVAFSVGFLSALAISRIRFSSILVVPISVAIFGVGFWAGVARVRVWSDKVDDLKRFLEELVSGLENGGDLRLDCLDAKRIEGFVEVIEGVRKNVEGSGAIVGEMLNKHLDLDLDLDWGLGLGSEGGKKENSKSGKRRKEFDFVEYLGGLFQENVVGAKALSAKDSSKGEVPKMRVEKGSVLDRDGKETEPLFSKDLGKVRESSENGKAMKTILRRNGSVCNVGKPMNGSNWFRGRGSGFQNDSLSYEEDVNNLNGNVRFTSKKERFERTVFKHDYKRRSLKSENGYSTDSGIDFFTTESEASSTVKEILRISDESRGNNRIREVPVDSEEKEGDMPPFSEKLVDEEFNQYMEEAAGLLKQARECLRSQADEEIVDSILYKSAKLLCTAEAMRPMSLLAVGQLGNTYLLHGELKLKISRELRTFLLRNDQAVAFEKLRTRDLRREDVESTLVEVCEECEELLIQAGRKYRTALSIDGNDARALYNWGLALSYRAQLIADIGPEAALDADKIYLSAIDKFDAMMSRSNLYASDALYRWGIVLQERSYLRPRNNREKVKLLHQAKSLFEDVLSIDSDNLQVREALVSCVSELNYNGKW